jgi:two-component sensor histidine kinase
LPYIVKSWKGALATDATEFEVNEDASKGQLTSAFKKYSKSKKLNKTLLTNFVIVVSASSPGTRFGSGIHPHGLVKNNMQLILSLYRIKLHGLRCPGLDEKLREIEGAVQSMRSIHENLYMEHKGDTVDLTEHLRTLTEDLRRGFRRDDVEIDLDVEGEAEISEALFIGLIVNELVVNAFRHGLMDRNGRIRLTLRTGEGMRRLVVEDDGKGCEKSVMGDGYGLELVRTVVEGELKGTLRIGSEKGCRIEMSWKALSTPYPSPA